MTDSRLTERQKKVLSILSLVIFAIFWVAVFYYVGRPMLAFVNRPNKFRAWVMEKGIFSRLIFIGMVVLQIIVAVIPGEPLELGAGYAFGAVEGTILCIVADLIGGIIVFALVRSIGVRMVEVFFSREKILSLRFLQKRERVNLFTYLIFILPGTPKDLLSYVVGLTDMRWSVWLLITSVARLPSVITSTLIGSAIGLHNYTVAAIAFGATVLLSIGGIIVYRIVCKRQNENNDTIEYTETNI